ncbi:aminopeptidase [Nanoarchaeota archaeon]
MTLTKAAEIIFKQNMNVQPNESVLIVTDEIKREIAKAFYDIGLELGLDMSMIEMKSRKVNGEEPPKSIFGALLTSSVALLITDKSLSHTTARREASKAGTRIASMPGITQEMLSRMINTDTNSINEKCNSIAEALKGANEILIKSKAGTEIKMSLVNMEVEVDNGMLHNKGDFGNLPAGEVCFAPNRGTSQGIFVIDASMASVGKVTTPIKITVDKGFADKIEGGEEAKQLQEHLDSLKSQYCFNIAELGIGCNEFAIVSGKVLEDEKVYGTAHIALGDNTSFGGDVKAPCHLDGVFHMPTILVDGRMIMKDGEYQAIGLEEYD